MSHNVSIKGVKITNMDVLARAVRNLAAQGIKVSLDQQGTFRTYPGQPNQSEYTVHLADARYDIGFNKARDGSHYEPVFDADLSYGNPLSCQTDKDAHRDREQNTIGKLMEEYSACLIEHEAETQGHSTSRRRSDTGELQVVAEIG